MGIEQLSTGRIGGGFTEGPQDIHQYKPVDYFRHIVAEDLAPEELRDQKVLNDIDTWKTGENAALLDGLVESSESKDE